MGPAPAPLPYGLAGKIKYWESQLSCPVPPTTTPIQSLAPFLGVQIPPWKEAARADVGRGWLLHQPHWIRCLQRGQLCSAPWGAEGDSLHEWAQSYCDCRYWWKLITMMMTMTTTIRERVSTGRYEFQFHKLRKVRPSHLLIIIKSI
jgi:hypothetical protein